MKRKRNTTFKKKIPNDIISFKASSFVVAFILGTGKHFGGMHAIEVCLIEGGILISSLKAINFGLSCCFFLIILIDFFFIN